MTADPIRDALEAAWRAMTVDPDDAPDGVIQHQRAAAAAAVAAFHRHMAAAMPDSFIYNRIVAIAVERAAKEGA